MYTKVEKPKENKSKSVANAIGQKKSIGKQGFRFVDNRPEAVAQRKLQEMANNNQIIKSTHKVTQLVSKISPLKSSIKSKANKNARRKALSGVKKIHPMDSKKISSKALEKTIQQFFPGAIVLPKKFNSNFHSAHKIQDELLSTKATLNLAHHLKSQGQNEQAKELIELSHSTRVPTRWMGHNVYDPNSPGTTSTLQHPTSKSTQIHSSSGNNHGNFNNQRESFALSHNEPLEIHKAAVAYSVNHGMQPPFAANSNKDHTSNPEAISAHNLREDLKDYVRGSRPKEVDPNKKWYPGRNANGRDVSPPRRRK